MTAPPGQEPTASGLNARSHRPVHWRPVALISTATMLSMSAWFSASFIVADLQARWDVPDSLTGYITFALQAGFIAGALASAVLGLADRIGSRILFLMSSLAVASLNALILIAPSYPLAVGLRCLTGVALAGVYPVAVKEIMQWVSPGRRATATGLLIAALTLGSAAPHLISALVSTSWEGVIVVTSGAVGLGGLLFHLGVPKRTSYQETRVFSIGAAFHAYRDKNVRRANYAYFGHMWELYAMWTWVGLFLSSRANGQSPTMVSLMSFVVIGAGALGAGIAGPMGDRYGKARIAGTSLVLSGSCAALVFLTPGWPFAAVVALCAVWGFWVIADSGLLSSLLGDHCPPEHLGSVVTLQLAGGYAISGITILLLPLLRNIVGWENSLPILAIGPVLAIAALHGIRGKSTDHTAPSGSTADHPVPKKSEKVYPSI